MTQYLTATLIFLSFLLTAHGQDTARITELNAYYAEIGRTVRQGDYPGMCALYHKDAVLVLANKTMPIAQALEGWKPGILKTKEGASVANVEFRLATRKGDATTAHETGIFYYTASDKAGNVTADDYIHFQMLLIKANGQWVSLMEYQQGKATEEEWKALPQLHQSND